MFSALLYRTVLKVSINLFRGEHWKTKELPFGKLPVLLHGDLW